MQIIRDLDRLTQRMQKKCSAFMALARGANIDVHVFETFRTQDRQNELYANGKSTTTVKHSRHQDGEAFDVAGGGEGKWHWRLDWNKLIEIGKMCELHNLSPYEQCHFEDNGKEFNQKDMQFKNDYVKIMKDSVPEADRVLVHLDAVDDEEQLKALLEIAVYRTRMKIKKNI